MKKIAMVSFAAIAVAATIGNVCAADEPHFGAAMKAVSQAINHGSASVGHTMIASGQLTSAALAVPLSAGGLVLGSAGAASVGMAAGSMPGATVTIGSPLPVSDDAITVMPPNDALNAKTKDTAVKP